MGCVLITNYCGCITNLFHGDANDVHNTVSYQNFASTAFLSKRIFGARRSNSQSARSYSDGNGDSGDPRGSPAGEVE
jgi:hypothetical protein